MKDRYSGTYRGAGSGSGGMSGGSRALQRRTALEARRGPINKPGSPNSQYVKKSVAGSSTSPRQATSPTKRYKANVAKKNRVTAAWERKDKVPSWSDTRLPTGVKTRREKVRLANERRQYKAPGKK